MRSLEDTPLRALAVEFNQHGLGTILLQALRSENVLDFACADTEGQGAESPMRGSVAIATHDGKAGLRDAKFGSDDVYDALVAAEHVEQPHTVLLAIPLQRFELQPGVVIHNAAIPGSLSEPSDPSPQTSGRAGEPCGLQPRFPRMPVGRCLHVPDVGRYKSGWVLREPRAPGGIPRFCRTSFEEPWDL